MTNRRTERDVRTDEVQPGMAIFRVPLLLGVASCVGLVSALVGDGVFDALSWLMLAAPLAVVAWAWRAR